jgi:hypothetical protein
LDRLPGPARLSVVASDSPLRRVRVALRATAGRGGAAVAARDLAREAVHSLIAAAARSEPSLSPRPPAALRREATRPPPRLTGAEPVAALLPIPGVAARRRPHTVTALRLGAAPWPRSVYLHRDRRRARIAR